MTKNADVPKRISVTSFMTLRKKIKECKNKFGRRHAKQCMTTIFDVSEFELGISLCCKMSNFSIPLIGLQIGEVTDIR